jgi:hypothetical protein
VKRYSIVGSGLRENVKFVRSEQCSLSVVDNVVCQILFLPRVLMKYDTPSKIVPFFYKTV